MAGSRLAEPVQGVGDPWFSAAAIDLRVRRVPNPLTFGTALLGLLLAAIHVTAKSPTIT